MIARAEYKTGDDGAALAETVALTGSGPTTDVAAGRSKGDEADAAVAKSPPPPAPTELAYSALLDESFKLKPPPPPLTSDAGAGAVPCGMGCVTGLAALPVAGTARGLRRDGALFARSSGEDAAAPAAAAVACSASIIEF